MNPNQRPIKLTFLVRALDYGGAQRQLISLAKALDKERFSVCVMEFYSGPLERELIDSGVQIISLNKRGRWDVVGFLWRLVSQLRRNRPDVLHGYLDIPNLLALFLTLFVRVKVVWGLRASTIDLKHYDWLRRLASKLERRFSHLADLIIINSAAGLEQHLARGFPREKMVVIPNGFDTKVFKPDREAGRKLRQAWGVAEETKLVGIVGRLDPMKDHPNFFQAAAHVSSGRDEVQFVCVGDGPDTYRAKLMALADELGIANKIIWQAATTDVSGVYNALDVLVSSSLAEGLPNVVGEAMACGVPCVVTDVGDSRRLVGDCGVVVPSEDSQALAEGMVRALDTNRSNIADVCRKQISDNFSLERLAKLMEEVIVALAGSKR